MLGIFATMESEAGVITIDHDEIRDWVEDRNGRPALAKGDESGTRLRISFGDSGEPLASITWTEFFKLFESENLAFKYDPDAMEVGVDPICELVDRSDHIDEIEGGGLGEEEDEEEFDDEMEELDEEEL